MSVNFGDNQKLVKVILIGIFISLVCIAVLTCLSALVISFLPTVPYGGLPYIMLAVEGLGVFPGAYVASAIAKSRGLMIGAICGSIVFLILLAVGMSVSTDSLSVITLIRAVVLIALGIFGGILGVNRKEKVHIK